jgi:acetyl esterase
LSNKVSPLLVEDDYLEANTPENTLLITAEIDILRDDGFIYAERLRRVDKRVNHVHYDSLFHGIFGLNTGPLKFDKANEIVHKVAHLVKQTLNVQQKV